MDGEELTRIWQDCVSGEIRRMLDDVVVVADERSLDLYLVGGFVRDLIMESDMHAAPDLDLVVEGDAIALVQVLVNRFGGKAVRHERFGTAKWLIRDVRTRWGNGDILPISVDFARARKESYPTPGALPKVKPGTIMEDLSRRDFSINAIALRVGTQSQFSLFDIHAGLKDIDKKTIRILHEKSFQDDPTRIFRAVRYETRLDFHLDDETERRLKDDKQNIRRLSGDRIRHEFDHIAGETKAARMLRRLDEVGVLAELDAAGTVGDAVFCALETWKTENDRSGESSNDQERRTFYSLWISKIKENERERLIERLNLDKHTREIIQETVRILEMDDAFWNLTPGEISVLLDELNEPSIRAAVFLVVDNDRRDLLTKYLNEWKSIPIMRVGETLRKKNVPGGTVYERIARKMRIATINHYPFPFSQDHYLEELIRNEIQ